MQRFTAVVVFLVFTTFTINAQSLATNQTNNNLLGIGSDHWSFFHNSEENTVFIDFETIDVNLQSIKVYNESKEVIIEEPLFDLPVDAIYELDLKGLPKGKYLVELHTFSAVLSKPLHI